MRIDRRSRGRRAAIGLTACACLVSPPSRGDDTGAARKPTAPIAEVVVRRAGRECFTSLVHASGYLVPRKSAVVMLVAPGYRITDVRAKTGDVIKQGDIVARAAPAGAPAAPAAQSAESPADMPLPSPASGRVLQSAAFVGMPTSQTPLFTIAVDGVIEASVAVPGVHVLELKTGQAARLTMGDGSVLDARVRRTPAVIDPASQTGMTRLAIDAPGALEPSRFVQATIEARRSCGIGVPIAALRRTSAGTYVQVLEHDVITRRGVTLGLADATDSEVTSGLAEGDVVVAGTGASREGDRVKPIFSDPQDGR